MKFIAALLGAVAATSSIADWSDKMNSPEDLEHLTFLQTGWALNNNQIYDADGDGVEDNMDFTHDELDKFWFPTVFNTAEDIYNTRHGNYPGHRQKEFYDMQSAPGNVELVKHHWQKW